MEKNTESKSPKVSKASNEKMMILSKSAEWDSKISKFIKEQETKCLLSKVPISSYILF